MIEEMKLEMEIRTRRIVASAVARSDMSDETKREKLGAIGRDIWHLNRQIMMLRAIEGRSPYAFVYKGQVYMG